MLQKAESSEVLYKEAGSSRISVSLSSIGSDLSNASMVPYTVRGTSENKCSEMA